MDRQCSLDHTRHTGGGFHVPDVRLQRTEHEWRSVPAVAHDANQRRYLNGIAQRRGRAVCFDVLHGARRDPGIPVGLAQDTLLGLTVWRMIPLLLPS